MACPARKLTSSIISAIAARSSSSIDKNSGIAFSRLGSGRIENLLIGRGGAWGGAGAAPRRGPCGATTATTRPAPPPPPTARAGEHSPPHPPTHRELPRRL